MKKETDGYHVIDMMSICLYIYEELKNYGVTLDIKDLIYRCYIHDLDEVLVGDIQRNIKYYNEKIYESINEVVNNLLHKNYSEDLIKDISNSKNLHEINGLIVKVADTLQSSLKIYEEVKLNNFHFNKVITEHIVFIKDLKNKVMKSLESFKRYDRDLIVINLILVIIDSFYSSISKEVNKLN
jgi:5'-deoxynucleotidase YfbR-like HD superfamily hydrolase